MNGSGNYGIIGTDASHTWQLGYSATQSLGTAVIQWTDNAAITLLPNNSIVGIGGTTASFPAMKRSSAAIAFRLADDSADADITAANLISNTAGKGLQLKSGTGARGGNAVLVGGTVTVTNTTVTANTLVLLTRKTSGGTIGTAITYTVSAGASFTINSDNILDTSTFTFMLVELN